MNRRDFITLIAGAAASSPAIAPPAARAQQAAMKRIGVLMGIAENDPESRARVDAFKQGLKELGWIEERNIHIDLRFAAGEPEQTRTYTAELVAMAPDAILANTTPVVAALQRATDTIPIVFVQIVDPLGRGFVASLARPGANITGFLNFEFSMAGKWLETLKQMAPRVAHVAAIFNPQTAPFGDQFVRQIDTAAPGFGVKATTISVTDAGDFDRAVSAFAAKPDGGLIVLPDVFNTTHREVLTSLAARYRLPAIYPFRYFAESGGLISDGVDTTDLFARSAGYIDRILKGAKPADLPVQTPAKFELVINLKTAKALGLEIPMQLMARADEVIE
jgi:putative ABC transport system substrate-binding protein